MKSTDEEQTFSPRLSEEEQRKCDDYEWALNDPLVRRKYAGKIVVVYHRNILGAGRTYQSAWAVAQRRRNCPEKHQVAMPVVSYPQAVS